MNYMDPTMKEYYETTIESLKGDVAQLEKELSQLREADRWVPVSERLPDKNPNSVFGEESVEVFVIDDQGNFDVSCYDYQSKTWSYNYEYDPEITHWKPPAPPTEQTIK